MSLHWNTLMVMKRLSIFLFLLVAVGTAFAQIPMRNLIVSMPDSILPLLTKVNREDCVDFREAGMAARVTNRMDATTELTDLTDNYARWQYTKGTVYEMKLLPFADTLQVLCMTHRLQVPVCDATVRFFDMQWNTLPVGRFITLPVHDESSSLLTTWDYVLSPSSTDLTVTTRSEYFVTEDGKDTDAEIRAKTSSTLLKWMDGRFSMAE